MLCVYINRGKLKQVEADRDTEYDVVDRGTELGGVSTLIEMKVNEAYGTHGQDDSTILEIQPEEAQYEELH